MQEGARWDLEQVGGWGLCFCEGVLFVCPVVLASFFCFEAHVFERRFEKRGIPALSIVNLLLWLA